MFFSWMLVCTVCFLDDVTLDVNIGCECEKLKYTYTNLINNSSFAIPNQTKDFIWQYFDMIANYFSYCEILTFKIRSFTSF